MLRSVVFAQVRKKFSKNAGFEAAYCDVTINFEKDIFKLKMFDLPRTREADDERKISEQSDLSDVLVERIKKRAQFKKLNVAVLKINFDKKLVLTDIYFIDMNDEPKHMRIEDLF